MVPSSLAVLNGRPQRLRVPVRDEEGQETGDMLEHLVHPLTYGDLATLQTWIDQQFPCPFEQAATAIRQASSAGKPFTVAQEQFLLKNAAELASRPRHLIGSEPADALLLSVDGFRQILVAAIRKGDATFDAAAADRLFQHMTQADLAKVLFATEIALVVNSEDPKAGPPAGNEKTRPTGGTGSRRSRRAAKARSRRGRSTTA